MKTNNGVCTQCQSKKNEIYFAPNNKVLPTWRTKNNVIKYTLPSELQNLTIAEKLLIQCVSPLVPIIHIKNGVLGTRGHVVSFFQDISGICTELPKIPSEVTMVKIIRTGATTDIL
jgi:citrate lyase alpha subunit